VIGVVIQQIQALPFQRHLISQQSQQIFHLLPKAFWVDRWHPRLLI
jgi:hypothetical protein